MRLESSARAYTRTSTYGKDDLLRPGRGRAGHDSAACLVRAIRRRRRGSETPTNPFAFSESPRFCFRSIFPDPRHRASCPGQRGCHRPRPFPWPAGHTDPRGARDEVEGSFPLVAALLGLGALASPAEAAHCGACAYPVQAALPEQCCLPAVRYRVCYQTVLEDQTRTCYRPVYRTVMKECRYTTYRPVYEQCCRDECYTVYPAGL